MFPNQNVSVEVVPNNLKFTCSFFLVIGLMVKAYRKNKKEVTDLLQPVLENIKDLGSKTREEVATVIQTKEKNLLTKYSSQIEKALYALQNSQVWIIMNEVLIRHCFHSSQRFPLNSADFKGNQTNQWKYFIDSVVYIIDHCQCQPGQTKRYVMRLTGKKNYSRQNCCNTA